jgi:Glycosyl hydrolase family 47
VGRLVGAWEVTRDELFLREAERVGEVLRPCFLGEGRDEEKVPPLPRVDVARGWCLPNEWHATVPAAVNLVMEWRALAAASGRKLFQEALGAQERTIAELQERWSFGGLIESDVRQSRFVKPGRYACAGIGSPADSYYEYLLKSALVAEGEERRRWVRYWWEVLDTVVDVLVVDVPGLGLVTTQTTRKDVEAGKRAEVPSAAGGTEIVFDHFSCYFPGLLLLLSRAHLCVAAADRGGRAAGAIGSAPRGSALDCTRPDGDV